MAADTATWTSGDVLAGRTKKIKRATDGSLFACSGISSEIHQFTDYFEQWLVTESGQGGLPRKFDIEKGGGGFGALIVRPDGRVLRCFNDLHIFPSCESAFYVEGSGAKFMFGALAQGATAEQAVRLCIRYMGLAPDMNDVQVERL
jgi:hypothetical protein